MNTPADKGIMAEYKTLLVTAAHILLGAENAITEACEDGATPNQIAGTILDVPAQLKQVSTLIDTVLILNQRSQPGNLKLYPAKVNGKRVLVTIPED